MSSDIIKKASDMVNKCTNAYLGVLDEKGFPHVSTVSSIKTDGIFSCYFATGLKSNKTRRIKKCDKASVCYQDKGNNVTLVGTAFIVTDQKIKNMMWKDWFIKHFPEGKEDPNYCLIKFRTDWISLWIDCESFESSIEDILKVQS